MLEYVIGPEGYKGFCQSVLTDGVSSYTGKTKEEFLAEGCTVVDGDGLYEIVKAFENSISGQWKEITEKEYDDALNVLPPVLWYNGGFFISEADTGSVHAFYQRLNGKFYTSEYSIYTSRDEIMESLKRYVAEKEASA